MCSFLGRRISLFADLIKNHILKFYEWWCRSHHDSSVVIRAKLHYFLTASESYYETKTSWRPWKHTFITGDVIVIFILMSSSKMHYLSTITNPKMALIFYWKIVEMLGRTTPFNVSANSETNFSHPPYNVSCCFSRRK